MWWQRRAPRGAWITFPGPPPARFLIREPNERIERALDIAMRAEDTDDALVRAFSEHILVRWEGVRLSDRTEVPCTPENAVRFFKALPGVFTELWERYHHPDTFLKPTEFAA